jgi:DNA-binding MarR family transcriptional regulator
MSEHNKQEDRVQTERMLGAMFRIPFQAMAGMVNQALVSAGFEDITPSHQSVFRHLPTDGARITELAESAQITKQSMGALVRQLEQGGYLERVPDPTDGRAVLIRRTERGWDVERVARESIARLEKKWAEELGASRMQQLWTLLDELVEVIENEV